MRKIIQISTCVSGVKSYVTSALCNDGTVWLTSPSRGEWQQLVNIGQTGYEADTDTNTSERVAIALETLVGQGNSLSAVFEETQETVKQSPESAAHAKEETKPAIEVVQQRALTHADLKAICLVKARADSKNRDKLKALLKEYNAVKANDVEVGKLAEVIGRIEAGEF